MIRFGFFAKYVWDRYHKNTDGTIFEKRYIVAHTGPKTESVGANMAGFQSVVTKRINSMRDTPGASVWDKMLLAKSKSVFMLCLKNEKPKSELPISNSISMGAPAACAAGAGDQERSGPKGRNLFNRTGVMK
jgi:hypothetical protein